MGKEFQSLEFSSDPLETHLDGMYNGVCPRISKRNIIRVALSVAAVVTLARSAPIVVETDREPLIPRSSRFFSNFLAGEGSIPTVRQPYEAPPLDGFYGMTSEQNCIPDDNYCDSVPAGSFVGICQADGKHFTQYLTRNKCP